MTLLRRRLNNSRRKKRKEYILKRENNLVKVDANHWVEITWKNESDGELCEDKYRSERKYLTLAPTESEDKVSIYNNQSGEILEFDNGNFREDMTIYAMIGKKINIFQAERSYK